MTPSHTAASDCVRLVLLVLSYGGQRAPSVRALEYSLVRAGQHVAGDHRAGLRQRRDSAIEAGQHDAARGDEGGRADGDGADDDDSRVRRSVGLVDAADEQRRAGGTEMTVSVIVRNLQKIARGEAYFDHNQRSDAKGVSMTSIGNNYRLGKEQVK